jgi:hypothetical protein
VGEAKGATRDLCSQSGNARTVHGAVNGDATENTVTVPVDERCALVSSAQTH